VSDGVGWPSDHTSSVQTFGVSGALSLAKNGTQNVLQKRAGFAGSRPEQSFQ